MNKGSICWIKSFCDVKLYDEKYQFGSVQSLSRVWLFATPWIAACQATLSITNSRSLLKLIPIESVMPSSHFIFCCPLLLLPPIPPSIRVFSNESTLLMRWPKYWSFSYSISPFSEHPELISFRMDEKYKYTHIFIYIEICPKFRRLKLASLSSSVTEWFFKLFNYSWFFTSASLCMKMILA